jgi:formate dehydrogenase subunit delta
MNQDDAVERQHQPAEIRMGEDIARAMAHLPPTEAAEEVATHLRKFWAPPMRQALLGLVDGGEPVSVTLAAGVEAYRRGQIDRAELREPSGG